MPQERKHKPKSEQPVAGRDLYLFFFEGTGGAGAPTGNKLIKIGEK
jgi:hypothetical protein